MRTRLLVCALATCAAVQGQVTGRVTDPSGSPVPGALVRSGAAGVATDGEGRFALKNVKAGRRRITVLMDGFTPEERSVTAPATDVHVVLRIAELHSEITVTADTAIEEPVPQLDIDTRELERLPTPSGDVIATLANWLGPISGSTGGMSVVVDGVETSVTKLSPERIAEVRISSNPFSAEFSRPGSSRIEITTKSGSERWRSTLVSSFSSSRFDARPAFASTKPVESENLLDATVSGPLGKKATLLLSAEFDQEREQALVVARTPAGDVRSAVPAPETEIESRIVFNYAPVTLRYSHDHERQRNSGVGGFRLPEVASDALERSNELQVSVQNVTHGWLNETQIRLERESVAQTSRTTGVPRISVDDAFTAGGAQADESVVEWSARLSQILAHSWRKHYVRFGVQSPELLWARLHDRTGREGEWRFASLDDYARGIPYAYSARQGDGRIAYSIQRWGAFVQDEWRVRPEFALSLGARWDTSTAMSGYFNFAPRVGAAWRVSKDTVIRAGAGLFYDFVGDSTYADMLRFNGNGLRDVLLRNPPFPLRAGFVFGAQPPNIVRIATFARSPRIWESSLSVEHGVLSISWRRSIGHDLFRSLDRNAPPSGTIVRPDPTFGQVRTIESAGRMVADSAQVAVKIRTLRVQAQYGRILSNTEGQNWLPAYSYDPDADWGYDSADRRWRIQAMSTFRLPRAINVGLIWRAQSGLPYTLRTGRDDNGDGIANDRPPRISRNTLRGTAEMNTDVRIGREFRFKGEDRSIELTLDVFNVLNRVNYRQFVGNIASPFFRLPVSATPPRRFQFGIRARF